MTTEARNEAADYLRLGMPKPLHAKLGEALAAERRATVERIRAEVLRREHEYLWTWDADTWTDADMGHSAEMIGDFLGILDEAAR